MPKADVPSSTNSELVSNSEHLNPKKEHIYFPNLDGLRFLAFLSVFFAHTFYSNIDYIQQSEWYSVVRFVGKHGALGVNFFFVLSGFLITYLLLSEKVSQERISISKFYMRRVLRIWPLYYAVVFVGYFLFPFVQSFFGKDIEESGLIYYLLFITNYTPFESNNAILGILWSIAVEEQFYLVWPIIIALVPFKKLNYAFLAVIIISFLFRNFTNIQTTTHSLSCMSDLAVGSWAAFLVFKRERLKSYLNSLPPLSIYLIYLLGMGLIFSKDIWADIYFLHRNERFAFSLFFVFVILEQSYAKNSFYKMGNLKILTSLGKYTYGLYMLHFVAIYIVFKLLTILNLNISLYQVLIVEPIIALGLSLILAYFSFHWLEQPFLRLKKRFTNL